MVRDDKNGKEVRCNVFIRHSGNGVIASITFAKKKPRWRNWLLASWPVERFIYARCCSSGPCTVLLRSRFWTGSCWSVSPRKNRSKFFVCPTAESPKPKPFANLRWWSSCTLVSAALRIGCQIRRADLVPGLSEHTRLRIQWACQMSLLAKYLRTC